jgi:Tol biopolymer transport system component
MRHRRWFSYLGLIALFAQRPLAAQTTGAVSATTADADAPRLFAPGVISTGDIEFGPAFEPDGKTVYFAKGSPGIKRVAWIMVSRFQNGAWTKPEIAPFSGRYTDIDPTLSPDGKKLFFASTRPTSPGTTEPKDLDIWVVEKTARGWGEPQSLGAPVNSSGIESTSSVTADGTLYFSSAARSAGRPGRRLYRSRLVDGKYGEPEALPAPVDGGEEDSNQYVSPDGSTMLFTSKRPGAAEVALFLTRSVNGVWSEPTNVGAKLNADFSPYTPLVSPDGKTFYFSSQRGAFDHPPFAPMSYAKFLETIRGPGNGLADIYFAPIGAIPYRRAP